MRATMLLINYFLRRFDEVRFRLFCGSLLNKSIDSFLNEFFY